MYGDPLNYTPFQSFGHYFFFIDNSSTFGCFYLNYSVVELGIFFNLLSILLNFAALPTLLVRLSVYRNRLLYQRDISSALGFGQYWLVQNWVFTLFRAYHIGSRYRFDNNIEQNHQYAYIIRSTFLHGISNLHLQRCLIHIYFDTTNVRLVSKSVLRIVTNSHIRLMSVCIYISIEQIVIW